MAEAATAFEECLGNLVESFGVAIVKTGQAIARDSHSAEASAQEAWRDVGAHVVDLAQRYRLEAPWRIR